MRLILTKQKREIILNENNKKVIEVESTKATDHVDVGLLRK